MESHGASSPCPVSASVNPQVCCALRRRNVRKTTSAPGRKPSTPTAATSTPNQPALRRDPSAVASAIDSVAAGNIAYRDGGLAGEVAGEEGGVETAPGVGSAAILEGDDEFDDAAGKVDGLAAGRGSSESEAQAARTAWSAQTAETQRGQLMVDLRDEWPRSRLPTVPRQEEPHGLGDSLPVQFGPGRISMQKIVTLFLVMHYTFVNCNYIEYLLRYYNK